MVVGVFTSVGNSRNSVSFLEGLCYFAADFFDDTGVIATDLKLQLG